MGLLFDCHGCWGWRMWTLGFVPLSGRFLVSSCLFDLAWVLGGISGIDGIDWDGELMVMCWRRRRRRCGREGMQGRGSGRNGGVCLGT